MSNILVAMLLSHFIGDFYLQTKKSVSRKYENYLRTLLHCLVYGVPGLLILLLYAPRGFACFYLAFVISHFIYDSVKFLVLYLRKKAGTEQEKKDDVLSVDWVFFVDQAAHILTIIAICVIYSNQYGEISVLPKIIGYVNMDAELVGKIIKAVLILTIILQPVSIAFGKLFNLDKLSVLKTKDSENTENIKGAGTVIGFLERLIIVALLFLGEYAAIGLVIAAKSIARFNSDVKAEFYIIGTFYGVVATLVPFLLIWR